MHCAAQAVSAPDISWLSGAHPAVAGMGDAPCSGDLLLGALEVEIEASRSLRTFRSVS